MSIDTTRFGALPENTPHRGGHIIIGYEIVSSAQTPSEEEDLQYVRESSQDLKDIKTADRRLPVEEKERIVNLLTPKAAKTHMKFMVENAFKLYTTTHEDGTPFVLFSDFVGDLVSMFQGPLNQLIEQSQENGWVKAKMPTDCHPYIPDAFKAFLEETFIIDRVTEDGTLVLKNRDIQAKQLSIVHSMISKS